MLIKSVTLVNFKSYAHAVIRFQPGVNAIIGPNGAGKSTILEAIGFALFNCRGAGNVRRLREGSNRGQVLLRFESALDQRDYEVERSFNQTATTRYRVIDPEINQTVAEGGDDVRMWLINHLRLEPGSDIASLFENTIGVPQGTFTAPFLLTAAQRKGVFDPLLQVEEYQRAAEKLLATSRILSTQAAELRSDVSRLEGLLAELPQRESELAALNWEIAESQAQLQVSEQASLELGRQLTNLDAAEAAVRENEARWNNANLACAAVEQQLETARSLAAEAEASRAICAATEQDHEAYVRLEEQARLLNARLAERDKLREKMTRLQAAETRLSTRFQLLEQELANLEALSGKLGTLSAAVEEQSVLEKRLAEAARRSDELKYAQRQTQRAGNELEQALEKERQVAVSAAEAFELETRIAAMNRDIAESQEELYALNAERAANASNQERLAKLLSLLEESTSANCPLCGQDLTQAHREELLTDTRNELEACKAEDNRLRLKANQVNSLIREKESSLRQDQMRLRKLPGSVELEQARAEVERRRQAFQDAQKQEHALATAPGEREKLEAALAALGNPRREYQRIEDQLQKEPALRAETEQVRSQTKSAAEETAAIREALAAYSHLDADVQANQQAREALQPAHLRYLSNSKSAQEFEQRQHKVRMLERESVNRRGALHQAELLLETARAAYSADKHLQVRSEYQNTLNALASARMYIRLKRERLSEVEHLVHALHEKERELGSKQSELRETVNAYSVLEQIRGWLREAGPQVTQRLVRRISLDASAIYMDIMNDHSGWLEWQSDYELLLNVRGAKREFRQLSGGEQMTAALALRLALLKQTSAIDIAFFDEPTAHLDPERRNNLADQISRIKGFTQMFVISHDDTFERTASSHVRIMKGADGSRGEVGL